MLGDHLTEFGSVEDEEQRPQTGALWHSIQNRLNWRQLTSCQKWVHRKCSGIKGSMYKVMKTFVCRGCVNPVTGTGHTSVDISVNANLELVDKFCYLWTC